MSSLFPLPMTASAMSEQSINQATATNNRKTVVALGFLVFCMLAVAAAFTWPAPSEPRTRIIPLKAVRSLPHDPASFCQGLIVENGQMYEGTGHYGQSRLRQLDLESGSPLIDVAMPDTVFGEGITILNGVLYQLTWKENVMLTYDPKTLKQTGGIPYQQIDRSLKEGWGLTHNGHQLIISDGSSYIRFVDAKTMKLVRRIKVKDGFRSIKDLNELEYMNGQILANVWYSDQIAVIDPANGRVQSWLDASKLRPASVAKDREAALNGIAWDSKAKKLYITGKNWPTMYQVAW
ncbi:MAG: glutaminyl-peptide cyclotransferase [Fuerstiella sp.]